MIYQILIFLFCLSFPVFSSPVVVIDENFKSLLIGKYVEYYEDKEGKLTIEEIQTNPYLEKFSPLPDGNFNFSFTSSAYWIRFQLTNASSIDTTLILALDNSFLDFIDGLFVTFTIFLLSFHLTIIFLFIHAFSYVPKFLKNLLKIYKTLMKHIIKKVSLTKSYSLI